MSYKIDERKVIYADLDPAEGVVLNLSTKYYYRLNETGQLIWQGLSAGKGETEIAQTLEELYEVSSEEALTDVHELVTKMKTEQLINPPAEAKYSVENARQDKKGSRIR